MARAILKRSKFLVMDEVRRLIIYVSSHTVTDSNEIIRRLLGLNIFNLFVICELRMTIHSVDYATDELIGKTIRQWDWWFYYWIFVANYSILVSEFAESTILTIAHRLRTVIDYDRVSVLTILKPHMAKKKYKYVGDDTWGGQNHWVW